MTKNSPTVMNVSTKVVGRLPAGTQIDFDVVLRQRNRDAMAAALAAIATPTGHYLSQARANQLFNPMRSQQRTVVAWLRSHGFAVTRLFANHLIVDARGTAAIIDRAFHTSILRYSVAASGSVETYYAPSPAPLVPDTLTQIVGQVIGLSVAETVAATNVVERTRGRVSGIRQAGISSGFYSPADFAAAYDLGSNSASQERMGIVMWCDPPDSGLIKAWKNSPAGRRYPISLTEHDLSGGQHGRVGDQFESDLDVEYASGAAPHVAIDYWQAKAVSKSAGDSCAAGNDVGGNASVPNALNAAGLSADREISGSFGECDDGKAPFDSVLSSAVLTGHNFFFSSGDTGDTVCGTKISQSYPGDSIYATSVGGTAFTNPTCSAIPPNPLVGYPGEVGWGPCSTGSPRFSSGGGFTTAYGEPSWQNLHAGGGLWSCASPCRGYPDVAGPADPTTAGALVCIDPYPYECYEVGGTSEATPMFAGWMADVDHYFKTNGIAAGVGNVTAALYRLADAKTYGADFHDIKSGHNGGARSKYYATTGWDPVTGLGSVDVSNLEHDWFCGTKGSNQSICGKSLPSAVSRSASANGFEQVSAGVNSTCALRGTGSVLCWGGDGRMQAEPPDGTFDEVSAGTGFACGRHGDGTVICWGGGGNGEVGVPPGVYTQVSAGDEFACGIKMDKTIACWGNPGDGETDAPSGTFTQVSAGYQFACAVRTTGSATCWGDNTNGQTQVPSGTFTQVSAGQTGFACGLRPSGSIHCWGVAPSHPPPPGSFTAVGTGNGFACALRSDGVIQCWGDNTLGESFAPPGSFSQVSVGFLSACGLRTNGSIACWGDDSFGESAVPTRGFTQSAAGGTPVLNEEGDLFGCGLQTSGHVVCWGFGHWCCLRPVLRTDSFSEISAGGDFVCGLERVAPRGTLGPVLCWGEDDPVQSAVPSGTFREVSAGGTFACARRSSGSIVCWGSNRHGQSTTSPAGHFSQVSAGADFACGLRKGGTIVCWGGHKYGQTTAPSGKFTQIDSGGYFACGRKDNGSVVCWGDHRKGETVVPAVAFSSITAGARFACGIQQGSAQVGQVLCWGTGGYYVKQVPSGTFSQISAGDLMACGIQAGAARCWGGLQTRIPGR